MEEYGMNQSQTMTVSTVKKNSLPQEVHDSLIVVQKYIYQQTMKNQINTVSSNYTEVINLAEQPPVLSDKLSEEKNLTIEPQQQVINNDAINNQNNVENNVVETVIQTPVATIIEPEISVETLSYTESPAVVIENTMGTNQTEFVNEYEEFSFDDVSVDANNNMTDSSSVSTLEQPSSLNSTSYGIPEIVSIPSLDEVIVSQSQNDSSYVATGNNAAVHLDEMVTANPIPVTMPDGQLVGENMSDELVTSPQTFGM